MIGKARFEKLLEVGHIGRVKTRNRMVKSGSDLFRNDWGRFESFYEALARGGVGLIITGAVAVDSPLGHRGPYKFHIEDDKYIPNFSEVVKGVHKHGCPIFLQLWHAGPWHRTKFTGLQPVSASPVDSSELIGPEYMAPRELTIPEIEEIEDQFVKAAERAQKAGFDGVEINASTCHLINSFLSRVWNKRQDAYGCGDLESRARFAVEIVRAIKDRLGQDFPISVKINGAEYGLEEGLTSEESRQFARILEQAGADAIGVRYHFFGSQIFSLFPEQYFFPEPPNPSWLKGLDASHKGAGAFVPLAEAVKKLVSVPVSTEGRLDPVLGERILQEGKADFISMTRRLLADPELPNKVASGRLDDIAPCTACINCSSRVTLNEFATCRANAALGIEREYDIKEAEQKKRVMVVGGGPSGMEAARVAALRGHEVLLYEREHKLGGLIPLAALVKGLEIEDLVALVRYLKTQITKVGVTVKLGTEVNLPLVEELRPDVAILAAGGIPSVQEIPGINGPNVVSNADLHRRLKIYLRFLGPRVLRWLTRFWMPLGKKVIIVGGAIQGCELAEFLTKRGRKVTIVDTAEELGDGLVAHTKTRLLGWLAQKGVRMMTEVKYDEITDKGLTILTKEGKRQTIEADTIVPAMSLTPNTELIKNLEGKVTEIYPIGDCNDPHLILEAIADGSRIARAI